jgi:hypothetical protein
LCGLLNGSVACADALYTGGHALGLVVFVVGRDHAHGLAFAQVAPQLFGVQLGVGANDVVGRTQDGAGGAVVLLQCNDLEGRVVQRQFLQVLQRGAAPAVDALVVVAHSGEAGALAHQQFEQLVLGGVGVLVLVNQHMAHLLLPALAHGGVVLQKFQRQADQVVKVNGLVGAQPFLVAGHQHGGGSVVFGHGLGQGLVCIQTGVFPAADGPLPLAGGVGIGGAARAILQDAGDVVGVQNAEFFFQPQLRAVLAQHAHAQRVEGADDDFFGRLAHQLARAFPHFGCSLVGEGDGGNALWGQSDLDQPRNFVRDDPRFARPCPGQHQTRTGQMQHSFLLRRVEADGERGRNGRLGHRQHAKRIQGRDCRACGRWGRVLLRQSSSC